MEVVQKATVKVSLAKEGAAAVRRIRLSLFLDVKKGGGADERTEKTHTVDHFSHHYRYSSVSVNPSY